MKQSFLIILGTLFILVTVAISYSFLPKLVNVRFGGTYELTFDEKYLHSNLYAPRDVSVKKESKDALKITWKFDDKSLEVKGGVPKEYASFSGFRIYRDGYWLTDIPFTQKSYTDTDLYPGPYTYKVSALTFDNKIEGIKSEQVSSNVDKYALNPVLFPVADVKSFLAEGDSITIAANVDKGEGWADIVTDYFNRNGLSINLTNAGVTGSTAQTVDDRIASEIAQIDPDLVTIAVGVNDIVGSSRDIGNESIADFSKYLESVIQKSRLGRNRDIVLFNIFYINCCSEKREAWDKEILGLANKYGLLVINVSDPVIKNGGAALLAGSLHPNAQGHKIIGEAVIEALKPYIHK